MSFIRKVGSLFRQAMPNHTVFNGSVSMPIIYQAFRHMSSSRLFVGGIPYGMDDQSLREAFTEFGDVIEARIILDRDTGRSRGFGFVSFSSSEEATHAISMDGKNLEGRIIHVNYATERTGGFRSSGGEYNQNNGFGSGGGYNRNDGFGSGGGGRFVGGSRESLGGGYGERFDERSSDFGGADDSRNPSGFRDEYGDEEDPRNDVGNMGRGY